MANEQNKDKQDKSFDVNKQSTDFSDTNSGSTSDSATANFGKGEFGNAGTTNVDVSGSNVYDANFSDANLSDTQNKAISTGSTSTLAPFRGGLNATRYRFRRTIWRAATRMASSRDSGSFSPPFHWASG